MSNKEKTYWQVDATGRKFELKKKNFFQKIFSKEPKDYSQDLGKLTDNFFEDTTEFFGWWALTVDQLSKSEKPIQLVFSRKEIWEKPWELLLRSLDKTKPIISKIHLLRSASDEPLEYIASLQDESLKTLIVLGDDGVKIDAPISPDKHANIVQDAWESLSDEIKEVVEKPIVVTPNSLEELSELIKANKPHIFWFNGHGEANGKTRLLFKKGNGYNWKDASELAEAIIDSECKPIYGVFWSCDTAKSESSNEDSSPGSPELIYELSRAGMASVLAMQAPLIENSAFEMAREMFRNLATGLPIHRALSRVRKHLMVNGSEENGRYSWAVPVLWTTSKLPDRFYWNAGSEEVISNQISALNVLRAQFRVQQDVSLIEQQLDSSFSKSVESWVDHKEQKRLWVETEQGNQTILYNALNTLLLKLSEYRLKFLYVDFTIFPSLNDETDAYLLLKEWANRVYSTLSFTREELELNPALRLILDLKSGRYGAWKELMSLEDHVIILGFPPKDVSGINDRFWDTINQSTNSRLIIFQNNIPEPDQINNWITDKLISEKMDELFERFYKEEPRLIEMAFLKRPLSYRQIVSQGILNQTELLDSRDFLIESRSFYLVPLGFRNWLRKKIASTDELKAIHYRCSQILVKIREPNDERIDITLEEEILEHYIEHGNGENIINQSFEIVKYYFEHRYPYSLDLISNHLEIYADELNDEIILHIVWAKIQLHKLEEGLGWLKLFEGEEPQPWELQNILLVSGVLCRNPERHWR